MKYVIASSLGIVSNVGVGKYLPYLNAIRLVLYRLRRVFPGATFMFVSRILFSLCLVGFVLLVFVRGIRNAISVLTGLPYRATRNAVALSGDGYQVVRGAFFRGVGIYFVFRFLYAIFCGPTRRLLSLQCRQRGGACYYCARCDVRWDGYGQ